MDGREPESLIELLYERSFESLKKIASIYQQRGITDKAEEISNLIRDHEDNEGTSESQSNAA